MNVKQIYTKLSGHYVIKSSAIVLIGSVVANALAYAYHLSVGRILGPKQYGELAALLSLSYVINVPSGVLQTTLTKFFSVLKAREKNGEAKSLILLVTKWIILLTLPFLLIIFLVSGIVANFLHITSPLFIVWIFVSFALYLLSVVFLSYLQAYQKFKASTFISNAGSVSRLIFGTIGAFYGVGATLIAGIVSNLFTYIMTIIPSLNILRVEKKQLSISASQTLGYSLNTLLATIGITAIYTQDVILVKHFFNAEDAGIYSSLSVLGKIIYFASLSLSFVLFPMIAERKERQSAYHKLVWTALAAVAGLSALLTIIYLLFPKLVVQTLFGSAFDAAIPLIGIFGVFISIYTLSSMLVNFCLALEKNSVWKIVGIAAFSQFLLLWLIHPSLQSVIIINALVSCGLLFSLIIFFSYAKKVS
jgi:O-antigen/teichoic acid export membrane protein